MKKWIRFTLAVILTFLILIPATPIFASPDWLGDWTYRVKLTIDNTDIDATLTNFPVLVYLSASSGRLNDDVSFVFDELTSDANRKKIAFTQSDGTTELYVEIEKWDDASEEAWLWVKVPSIASDTDTDLYLYYDSSKPDNTDYVGDTNSTPAENVWDSNFGAVWHLAEASGTLYDSTSNSNDGTGEGNPTYEVTGKINSAIEFDGTDAYVDVPHNSSIDPYAAWTLESWVKRDATGSQDGLIEKYDWMIGKGGYLLRITSGNKLFVYIIEGQSAQNSGTGTATLDSTTVWYYVVGTFDATTDILAGYVDGGQDSQNTGATLTPLTTSLSLKIGAKGDDVGEKLDGKMDEVRISNIVRTPAWIKASYESGGDDLLDFGSEETLYVPTVTNSAADNMTGIGADLYGEITVTGGVNPTTRGFEWDIDTGSPYANDWYEDGDFGLGTFDHTFTDMPGETTIYWRAYATNPRGTGYSGELSLNTTALPLPGAPTNFTLTLIGDSVSVSWVMGIDAVTTVLRRQAERYPVDITDGVEAYNGTGTSFDDTGLNIEDNEYFYRAWHQNPTGYSTDYAQGLIGGTGMLFIGLIALALGLTVFASRQKFILTSMAAAIGWLALGILLLTSPSTINMGEIGEPWVQALGFVFVLMTITPLLFQIRTDTKHESQVRFGSKGPGGYPGAATESWTEWGPKRKKKGPPNAMERQLSYRRRLKGGGR